MFIMNTLILHITKVNDKDFLTHNAYNICYLVYQSGLLLAMFTPRFYIFTNLPMFPGLLILILLLLIFMNFQSKNL